MESKPVADLVQQMIELGQITPEERAQIELISAGLDEVAIDEGLVEEPAAVISPEPAAVSLSSPAAAANENNIHETAATTVPGSNVGSERTESSDARFQISKMGIPEKIKAAMFGNSTCRAVLIRDTNKLIQQFVLKNPRLQLREVEEFARNPNLSDAVLRTIATNSAWMKSYALKWNIVSNPKTPIDVSLKWVRFLNVAEIRRLSKSKNVPQAIVSAARKKLDESASK